MQVDFKSVCGRHSLDAFGVLQYLPSLRSRTLIHHSLNWLIQSLISAYDLLNLLLERRVHLYLAELDFEFEFIRVDILRRLQNSLSHMLSDLNEARVIWSDIRREYRKHDLVRRVRVLLLLRRVLRGHTRCH